MELRVTDGVDDYWIADIQVTISGTVEAYDGIRFARLRDWYDEGDIVRWACDVFNVDAFHAFISDGDMPDNIIIADHLGYAYI